jgi:hypothetical protein
MQRQTYIEKIDDAGNVQLIDLDAIKGWIWNKNSDPLPIFLNDHISSMCFHLPYTYQDILAWQEFKNNKNN